MIRSPVRRSCGAVARAGAPVRRDNRLRGQGNRRCTGRIVLCEKWLKGSVSLSCARKPGHSVAICHRIPNALPMQDRSRREFDMPGESATKLTMRAGDALSTQDRDAVFWDRELPGFCVRVYCADSGIIASTAPGARSTWYRPAVPGGTKRAIIGPHGTIQPETARRQAAVMIDRIKRRSVGGPRDGGVTWRRAAYGCIGTAGARRALPLRRRASGRPAGGARAAARGRPRLRRMSGEDCCVQTCAHRSLTGTGAGSHCGERDWPAVHREGPQVGA